MKRKIKTSKKLQEWMDGFYAYSSDIGNKDSDLLPEFKELREIIKEIKRLEVKE